jgi:tRNA threonylcarbamoyladenosine biosynthesis protein TsaE
MKKQTFFSKSAKDTRKIGQGLAAICLKAGKNRNSALVIGLRGDLGGGKTNFSKGFAKGLGVKGTISSPTFVIQKTYELKSKTEKNKTKKERPEDHSIRKFFHIDAYRVANEKEMETIGFSKTVRDPLNIIVVEWVENILGMVPKDTIIVSFEHAGRSSRRITIDSPQQLIFPADPC